MAIGVIDCSANTPATRLASSATSIPRTRNCLWREVAPATNSTWPRLSEALRTAPRIIGLVGLSLLGAADTLTLSMPLCSPRTPARRAAGCAAHRQDRSLRHATAGRSSIGPVDQRRARRGRSWPLPRSRPRSRRSCPSRARSSVMPAGPPWSAGDRATPRSRRKSSRRAGGIVRHCRPSPSARALRHAERRQLSQGRGNLCLGQAMLGRVAGDLTSTSTGTAQGDLEPPTGRSPRPAAGCRRNEPVRPAAASGATLLRCKWPIRCQRTA